MIKKVKRVECSCCNGQGYKEVCATCGGSGFIMDREQGLSAVKCPYGCLGPRVIY